MQDLNQRISKIEVLLQKINFLVSNVKNNSNETTAKAEFQLIQSYIAELNDLAQTVQPRIAPVESPYVPSIQKKEHEKSAPVIENKLPRVEKSTLVVENVEEEIIEEKAESIAETSVKDIINIPSSNGTMEKPTLNETLKHGEKDLVESVVASKIKDLKTAIDINQKFAYINELFKGDVDSFAQALDKLNSFADLGSANEYLNVTLKNKHGWTNEGTLKSLQGFVARRYL